MGRLVDAHLHRFGDKVAISFPGKGETKYLSASEAKALAKELNRYARNIKDEPKFSESTIGSAVVKLTNEGSR